MSSMTSIMLPATHDIWQIQMLFNAKNEIGLRSRINNYGYMNKTYYYIIHFLYLPGVGFEPTSLYRDQILSLAP